MPAFASWKMRKLKFIVDASYRFVGIAAGENQGNVVFARALRDGDDIYVAPAYGAEIPRGDPWDSFHARTDNGHDHDFILRPDALDVAPLKFPGHLFFERGQRERSFPRRDNKTDALL